jgi:hypothetical protein
MRKRTVKTGLRFIAVGILCVMVATFFHDELSRLFFLDLAGEARLTFLGFFLGGLFSALGVLTAAVGFLQSGYNEARVRLAPTVFLLFSLIVLFFALAYTSVTLPRAPDLPQGESINI